MVITGLIMVMTMKPEPSTATTDSFACLCRELQIMKNWKAGRPAPAQEADRNGGASAAKGGGGKADRVMAHIAQRRELHRQRCIIERVVLRMTNTSKFASFERWRGTIKEKKAMAAMSKVVLRWNLQPAVRCFGAWSELTTDEVRKRHVMREIVTRMLHRSLSFAMDLWQQKVSATRQEQAEEEEKRGQSIMSRMVRREEGDADGTDGNQGSTTLEDLADLSMHGSEKTKLKRNRTMYQYLKLRLKALAKILKRHHLVRDPTEHR